MYICIYICIYVYIYVYICIYIYNIYIRKETPGLGPSCLLGDVSDYQLKSILKPI